MAWLIRRSLNLYSYISFACSSFIQKLSLWLRLFVILLRSNFAAKESGAFMNSLRNQSSWNIIRIGLIGSAVLLLSVMGSAHYRNEDSPRQPPEEVLTRTENPNTSRPMPGVPPTSNVPAVLPASLMVAKIDLIDGKSKKLSDYSGKVLVVDLWATWCGPCRQEIPHLVEIAKTYKSKGVEVIGLTNEDPESDVETVVRFSKNFEINYPIGWATPEMQLGLTRGRNGIPQTLIIGRDGKVLNHFVGFSALVSPSQMKAALEQALAS